MHANCASHKLPQKQPYGANCETESLTINFADNILSIASLLISIALLPGSASKSTATLTLTKVRKRTTKNEPQFSKNLDTK